MVDKKIKILIAADGKQAERELSRVNKSFDALAVGATRFIASMAAGLSVERLISDFVAINRESQNLKSSLVTVTGSTEEAEEVFASLRQFAKQTPFELNEVVNAFIKMKALGLDPSEAALRSYGDTASAMGKSLNQFIEAVADATTGEYERLKEFGIKSRSEGDRVSFTFRGVTTTVRKNADEIQAYLKRIGEVEFAGDMSRKMDTLGGAISNLRDNYTSLMTSLGETGSADLAAAGIVKVSGAIGGLERIVRDLDSALDDVNPKLGEFTGGLYGNAMNPAYNSATFGVWGLVQALEAYGAMRDEQDRRNQPSSITIVPGDAAWPKTQTQQGPDPRVVEAINKQVAALELQAKTIRMTSSQAALYKLEMEGATPAQLSAARAALATIDAFNAQAEALREQKKLFEDIRSGVLAYDTAQYPEVPESLLAGLREWKQLQEDIATGALAYETAQFPEFFDDGRVQRRRDFDDLVSSLKTEEELIDESYIRRKQIILDNTAAASVEQAELMSRLNAKYALDVKKLNESTTVLTEFQVEAFRSMQDAASGFFEDALNGHLDSFEDYVSAFGKMVNRMVADYLAQMALMSAFGKDFGRGGALGGWLGAAVGLGASLLGGGGATQADAVPDTYDIDAGLMNRAAGGPATAMQPYIVGEKEPEVFVPSVSGRITPLSQLGGQPINISISVGAGENELAGRLERRVRQVVHEEMRAAL